MNIEDINKFKGIIEDSLNKLSSRVIDFEVDSDGDECDEMQANVILDIAYAERDRNNTKIKNMWQALFKIKNGDYGYCEECGEDIGLKRLEIFPDAKYCVICAEKMEKEIGKIR